MENVYAMKLHETITLDANVLTITRVPGGWIYRMSGESSVFVPFDNDFLTINKVK